MSEPTQSYRILCITSAIKGQALLRELKRQGCVVILLTEDRWRDSPEWPYESIDHLVYMPSLYRKQEVMNQVGYMLRGFFECLRRHIAFEREHILPKLAPKGSQAA
ncbi:MAG: hypothetical protein HC853_19095 [Anaerolineae bacterium]|nr:hypothetical protein [Anaerolineae bacterium]